MKYTYRYKVEGEHTAYLEFMFDRQLSDQHYYRNVTKLAPPVGSPQENLLNAVASVKGVISNDAPTEYVGSELSLLNGNILLIRVAEINVKQIPLLASTIVKKVQRRIARGESRKRITFKQLEAEIKRLGKITWGE